MRIARFVVPDADPRFAVVEGLDDDESSGASTGPSSEAASSQAVLAVLEGDPLYRPLQLTGERVPLGEARLLAPVIPRSKVIGVGRNYAAHAAEMGAEPPAEPVLFLKPNTAVIGPGEAVVLPPESAEVHHEAELGVVIGRLCRDVPVEQVDQVVLGYLCADDVTARDLQRRDGQWARAKGFDTFCPLGPWLRTDFSPADQRIECRVNGEVRQQGRLSDMVHDVPHLVATISRTFTLLPGDVILTGTPAGVGPLAAGDRVEVEVAGLGTLEHTVTDNRRDR